jgi:hypothetical protein
MKIVEPVSSDFLSIMGRFLAATMRTFRNDGIKKSKSNSFLISNELGP